MAINTQNIPANSPDVVKADIAEILHLRAENERLNKEADWLAKDARSPSEGQLRLRVVLVIGI